MDLDAFKNLKNPTLEGVSHEHCELHFRLLQSTEADYSG